MNCLVERWGYDLWHWNRPILRFSEGNNHMSRDRLGVVDPMVGLTFQYCHSMKTHPC